MASIRSRELALPSRRAGLWGGRLFAFAGQGALQGTRVDPTQSQTFTQPLGALIPTRAQKGPKTGEKCSCARFSIER